MSLTRLCLTLALLAVLFPQAAGAHLSAQHDRSIQPGLYYDPEHDGHGFDLQPVGLSWVMVFYSYDSDGNPEWLLGVLDENEPGILSGSLDVFSYQADRLPPQQSVRTAGSVSLDFAGACPTSRSKGEPIGARFNWSLDGASGQWCVQPLLNQSDLDRDFTGLWYGGEADAGWGISLDFAGPTTDPDTDPDADRVEVQVLFYYDEAGTARWALGSGTGGATADLAVHNYRGYCRSCEPRPLEPFPAGSISHHLEVVDGLPGGQITIDVIYAPSAGSWRRQDTSLSLLSEPAPGLIPMPDQVEPDRIIAILNTSVVPMTGPDEVIPHQMLLISDGRIVEVGNYGAIAVPEGAVRIDGRDLYVGPGLHDMHTHFSFGGITPMREAGTLFIANGVTTVLNMGDGGTQNLPGTDSLFSAGTFIGPAVYAGAAAYGPGDGRAASATVSSPAEATRYAENAQRAGYQFIKLYNSLSPAVVQRFIAEGRRLGMPVNGHLPKTMTMRTALESGQGMVAHVAEVYFTLFSNSPNDDLLPQAAALMLENGTYLTDTLTASESFAANYGGNEEAFMAFSRREGILYQPTSFAENGWRNFFESSVLQPAGSQPGQLDGRLAYFKKMVRYFSDAGVPLILGTDSPGHIGVISGFSVHENLRLYDEIGLSAFDAYAAASRNPGAYLSQSLEVDTGWGTVEVNKRADLLLLEANPLESVQHLKRPLGVMTRGRFYSRSRLQQALGALDAKYRDPFTLGKSLDPQSVPAHPWPWCRHEH
ncbi:MAG: amidohydrolase family protein [Xanthomonadales bacterium]|nr:amidohydrolase family protein [Xanthomonadales bacterium]